MTTVHEAAWLDVVDKAKRLRSSGAVAITRIDDEIVAATVRGDHGVYSVELYRQYPGAESFTIWDCDCGWGEWAFRRQVQYVGRMCSHATAVVYEVHSRENRKDSPEYRWGAVVPKVAHAGDNDDPYDHEHEPLQGPFFHGTHHEFKPGDLVHPPSITGERSRFEEYTPEKGGFYDSARVYVTNNTMHAGTYAINSAKTHGGEPHVYEIEPVTKASPTAIDAEHMVQRDPEYLHSGFGSDQGVIGAGRVKRKLPREEWWVPGRHDRAATASKEAGVQHANDHARIRGHLEKLDAAKGREVRNAQRTFGLAVDAHMAVFHKIPVKDYGRPGTWSHRDILVRHDAMPHDDDEGRLAAKGYHLSPPENRESIQRSGIDWNLSGKPEEQRWKGNHLLRRPEDVNWLDPHGWEDLWEVEIGGLDLKPDPWDTSGGEVSVYSDEPIEPQRLTLVRPGTGRRASLVRPTKGMFGPGKAALDPRLFDGDQLREEVRTGVLGLLDAFWRPLYGDWTKWARVYLAGSGASHWWDSDHDLDILIGMDVDEFKREHPAFANVDESALLSAIDTELKTELDPTTTSWAPLEDAVPMEVTFYVNPGAWDIRAIEPYAAYDITNGQWVVRPPSLPGSWGPQFFPEIWWRQAQDEADFIDGIMAEPEPTRTEEALAEFEKLHQGRQDSYRSLTGKGWLDFRQFLWQVLDQNGYIRKLYLIKHPELATTAGVWTHPCEKCGTPIDGIENDFCANCKALILDELGVESKPKKRRRKAEEPEEAPEPSSFDTVHDRRVHAADDDDYRGQHQPNPDGPRSHDLTEGDFAPGDIYDHPDWYGAGEHLHESIKAIHSIRGKPDAKVTVHRAAPHGVADINPGDWVTFSKGYAQQHAIQDEDPSHDWPVVSKEVSAADVRWAGDDLNEFGYFPQHRDRTPKSGSARHAGGDMKAEDLRGYMVDRDAHWAIQLRRPSTVAWPHHLIDREGSTGSGYWSDRKTLCGRPVDLFRAQDVVEPDRANCTACLRKAKLDEMYEHAYRHKKPVEGCMRCRFDGITSATKPKTKKDEEDPQSLRSTLNAFAEQADPMLRTQQGSFDRAYSTAVEFADFAKAQGHEQVSVTRLQGSPEFERPHPRWRAVDPENRQHFVVHVDGKFVDWAARQFEPDAPFPKVHKDFPSTGWKTKWHMDLERTVL